MENLTIEQRIAKIRELAGKEISVALNLNIIGGTINITEGRKAVVENNVFKSSSINLD